MSTFKKKIITNNYLQMKPFMLTVPGVGTFDVRQTSNDNEYELTRDPGGTKLIAYQDETGNWFLKPSDGIIYHDILENQGVILELIQDHISRV